MYTGLLVLVLLIVAFTLFSRRGGKGIQQIDAVELQTRMKESPNSLEVIDVREPYEFSGGHIVKAKNIPLGKLDAKLGDLPKNKDVVFVCRSGNRSMAAARKATKVGLTAVYNMSGGMIRWKGPVKR